MNIFKKALIVALSIGLVSVPTVTKEVEAADVTVGQVLYLKPNANWKTDNARFAIYSFGSSENWQSMTKVANGDSVYRVVINKQNANIIFCRMNPNAAANNWNNKWNQTADLKWSTGNMYTVTEGTWDKGGGSWSTYKEWGYTLYNNDGTSASKTAKNYFEHGKAGTLPEYTPSREGYNFLGWSTSSTATTATYQSSGSVENVTADVKLYAVWEEAAATDCHLTYVVNGHETKVTATIGTTVEENIPEILGYNVLSWNKTGEVTGDDIITATKYYKTFDEVKGELSFSYSYYLNLVVFQCPIGFDDGVPTLIGKNSKTQDTKSVEMAWCADAANEKKEWYANLDAEFDILTFKWKNKGVAQTHTVNRDYVKNAIWYDSATSNGNYEYDISSNPTVASGVEYKVNNVSNMKLRVGTLALLASDFAGVETYGIRIAQGKTIAEDNYYGPTWSSEKVVKVDANGNADENGKYIRWNAVINDIPADNYNDEFTAVAYVVIDGTAYDLCEARTVSVTSLAKLYSSLLDGVEAASCQFIVDNYQA